MSVLAYHPETQASMVLTDEQLAHMRIAGWMLRSEYDEQARAAQAAADAAAQPAKPSKTEGK